MTNSPIAVTVPAGVWNFTAFAGSLESGVIQNTRMGLGFSPSVSGPVSATVYYFNSPGSASAQFINDTTGGVNIRTTIGPYGDYVCGSAGSWTYNGMFICTSPTTITSGFALQTAGTNQFKVYNGAYLKVFR